MNEDEQKGSIHQLYEEDVDGLLRGGKEYKPFYSSKLSASYSDKFLKENTPDFT